VTVLVFVVRIRRVYEKNFESAGIVEEGARSEKRIPA